MWLCSWNTIQALIVSSQSFGLRDAANQRKADNENAPQGHFLIFGYPAVCEVPMVIAAANACAPIRFRDRICASRFALFSGATILRMMATVSDEMPGFAEKFVLRALDRFCLDPFAGLRHLPDGAIARMVGEYGDASVDADVSRALTPRYRKLWPPSRNLKRR